MISRLLMKGIQFFDRPRKAPTSVTPTATPQTLDVPEPAPPSAPSAPANPFGAAFIDLPLSQRPGAMAAAHKLQAQYDARTAQQPRVSQPQTPVTRSASEIARIIRASPVGIAYAGLSDTEVMAQWLEDRAVTRSFE